MYLLLNIFNIPEIHPIFPGLKGTNIDFKINNFTLSFDIVFNIFSVIYGRALIYYLKYTFGTSVQFEQSEYSGMENKTTNRNLNDFLSEFL